MICIYITQVLLLTFTDNVDLGLQTQMLELFCGEGRVSSVFQRAGVPTVGYDIKKPYHGRSMDFLSSGGYASTPQLVWNPYIPTNMCLHLFFPGLL